MNSVTSSPNKVNGNGKMIQDQSQTNSKILNGINQGQIESQAGTNIMASRKSKFMNQQSKHKVNMSADSNMQSQTGVLGNIQSNHTKNISMSGMPYEKMKLSSTGKQGGKQKHFNMTGDDDGTQVKNSRNNHTRMPSLPNAMQGGIGANAFGGSQLHTQQVMGQGKRQSNNGLPININANDITFANNFNNKRKFGNAANGPMTTNAKLLQLNLNNGQQQQIANHNFVVQNSQNGQKGNYGQLFKKNQFPGQQRNDQKYMNQQILAQKRTKAHSGLANYTNQNISGQNHNGLGDMKNNNMRQQRVRSQLGNHQPLDSMNIVQQSVSQQKHQGLDSQNLQSMINSQLHNKKDTGQGSRKSNNSGARGRRRMIESPEMFRNAANQSFSQQQAKHAGSFNQQNGKQATPLRGTNLKKKVPSRPSSAHSNNKDGKNFVPQIMNQKSGHSMQGLGVNGLAQGQGLQGVQTNSQKQMMLMKQQQLQQQQNQQQQHQNSAAEAPEDVQKPQVAVQSKSGKISNVVTKFSFATKGGIAPHNPGKTNQDAYITSPHIMGLKHCHFFSVCDGHGKNGREVSGLLKHRLSLHVENCMKKQLGSHDFNKDYPETKQVHNALMEAFTITQGEVSNMMLDTRYSGSTCVSVMTLGRKIYMANVGDSRGIVIRQGTNMSADPKDNCECTSLTRDHKPDDPSEGKRILDNGGRIDSFRDQNNNPLGPLRVWLKNEDVPGLAMTRSFGDSVSHSVGCNAIPELGEYSFTKEDKIVVIASDGVWEFLENIDVARIVYPFYLQKNAEGAAENLVRASFKRWRKEESVVDDITCIVIFLDVK